jgi:hypothetical protein
MGVYEAWFYRLFLPGSPEPEWNSFNAGEFFFPRSRLSLLPLALACGGILVVAVRSPSKPHGRS